MLNAEKNNKIAIAFFKVFLGVKIENKFFNIIDYCATIECKILICVFFQVAEKHEVDVVRKVPLHAIRRTMHYRRNKLNPDKPDTFEDFYVKLCNNEHAKKNFQGETFILCTVHLKSNHSA